jgi:hypothetical protein
MTSASEKECEDLANQLISTILEETKHKAKMNSFGHAKEQEGEAELISGMRMTKTGGVSVPKAETQVIQTSVFAEEVPKRQPSPRRDPQEFVYQIKEIKYQEKAVRIVLQNENGPCPLIAIVNVLVLQGSIQLPKPLYQSSELLGILGNFIMEKPAKNENEEYARCESIELLPTLLHGMDINVYFENHDQFEYTKQLAIFDFLSIHLVHGWLWNPSEFISPTEKANLKSYNHLVEYLIEHPNGIEH